jgi:galacturonosyltransferase
MKKVLFLANHFITLYSFRKELISRLVNEGHDVYLSLPESEDNKFFVDLGCKIVPTEIDRRGVNPFKDVKLIRFYKKILHEISPDIIFSYTIKPNIYGTIASNGKYKQVCNITGTGGTFLKKSFVSEIAKILYRISIKKCYKVFFQNTGDRDYFIQNKLVSDNWDMLPGSGCNLSGNPYSDMPECENTRFIFVGRVMKLKGIEEYLKAARIIKQRYPNTTFYIAGWNEEPEYQKVVSEYQNDKIVDYVGFRKDISDWIVKCHCIVLPSHGGEGVPNVLLESAATGRICIGSKINGTTDVIEEGKNGFLFDAGDYEGLVNAMEKVIALPYDSRREMGRLGRSKIEKEFDRQIVIEKYMSEL